MDESFVRNIIGLRGEEGRRWLQNLPEQTSRLARRWGLTLSPPYHLSYNYVAPCVRENGESAVLKIGYPNGELRAEAAALRGMNPEGVCRLLEEAPDEEAMLLERVTPGVPLLQWTRAGEDERATELAAGVMRRLWSPGLEPEDASLLASVEKWGRGWKRLRERYEGGTGPLPEPLVARAEGLWQELSASAASPVLLHGDLHHENILSSDRSGYLAIDPKGLIGEPAFEAGALLRNPDYLTTLPDPRRCTERRLAILAEHLEIDRERLQGWGIAQAVLSAWWCLEDNADTHSIARATACAEILIGL